MMANWDLSDLRPALSRLKPKILLIVGRNDRAVPPSVSETLAKEIAGATIESIPHAGHLAHEEQPERVFALIEGAAIASGSHDEA